MTQQTNQIPPGHKKNLDTLIRAAKKGNLGMMQCQEISSGEYVTILVCSHVDDDGMIVVTPFAKMYDTNPYEELTSPLGETVSDFGV